MKTAEEYAAEAAETVFSILGQRMRYIETDDVKPVTEALTPLFKHVMHDENYAWWFQVSTCSRSIAHPDDVWSDTAQLLTYYQTRTREIGRP